MDNNKSIHLPDNWDELTHMEKLQVYWQGIMDEIDLDILAAIEAYLFQDPKP